MTPDQLREAREYLGLTQTEAAALLETDRTAVGCMERSADMRSHRAPPARVARLYQAMLSGWRPDDWPARLRGGADLEDLV